MPPNTSSDFSFSKKGQLIMSVDPASGSAPSMLSTTSSILTNGSFPPKRQTPPTPDLQKWILDAAKVGGAKTLTHNLTNEFDMIANRSTECVSVSVVVRACMRVIVCACACGLACRDVPLTWSD